jgi:hypothetical protein
MATETLPKEVEVMGTIDEVDEAKESSSDDENHHPVSPTRPPTPTLTGRVGRIAEAPSRNEPQFLQGVPLSQALATFATRGPGLPQGAARVFLAQALADLTTPGPELPQGIGLFGALSTLTTPGVAVVFPRRRPPVPLSQTLAGVAGAVHQMRQAQGVIVPCHFNPAASMPSTNGFTSSSVSSSIYFLYLAILLPVAIFILTIVLEPLSFRFPPSSRIPHFSRLEGSSKIL